MSRGDDHPAPGRDGDGRPDRGRDDDHPAPGRDTDAPPLLSVRDLRTQFPTAEGTVRAVDGASFDVYPGETVCLVGESGSGKTVACESITRLVDSPGEVVDGEVRFDDRDLLDRSERELRAVRGDRIAYVFQDPHGSLDPVYTVGEQVAEAVRDRNDVGKRAARERAVELLDRVGLPNPASRADDYPHQLSGGMKQRVAIAAALAGDPDLLIADEPTTALDVTIQAEILDLFAELGAEEGLATLFVTHDLGVVAGIADRVVVMYAGRVMERGPVTRVFERPAHPYTRGLLDSLPGRGGERIGGEPPEPLNQPAGCPFHPRCPHAVGECRSGDGPPLYGVDGGGDAACVFHDGVRDPTVLDSDPESNTEESDPDPEPNSEAEATTDGAPRGATREPDASASDADGGNR
ncbi:ABC transporter ATP-binding protein [Halobaculum magnesiiphilum]|uniref:Nickel import system ATP-binding protein NikD n=1 Tax=Halobaculum magnesiiphilum TaxID=1017351 RepID=A0A8T8WBE4_9EURY|nr:ABC transporter ATP-binding protein [Halobaculum magnesiiphilum]QZP37141.1 ABC transporter ATP-binding protein [Halobaculum magnesiiphilum]